MFGQTLNRSIESQWVCPDVIIAFGTGYCACRPVRDVWLKIHFAYRANHLEKKTLGELPIKLLAQTKSYPQIFHFSIGPNFPGALKKK